MAFWAKLLNVKYVMTSVEKKVTGSTTDQANLYMTIDMLKC